MSHKAGSEFFAKKKPWSHHKDRILTWYLKPYLIIIRKRSPRVLLVDGFAGKGYFDDGHAGSPIKLCELAREARSANFEASVLCVEAQREFYQSLRNHVAKYPFARVEFGEFADKTATISEGARGGALFLYIDPFTYAGLDWDSLVRVIEESLSRKESTEVLLNLNAASFVRAGLAAVRRSVPEPEFLEEDGEEIDFIMDEMPGTESLNKAAGGAWWQSIVLGNDAFAEMVGKVAMQFHRNLAKHLPFACYTPILAQDHHRVPKYFLMFASGHPKALFLMNDNMAKNKGKREFAINLFAPVELSELLLQYAATPIKKAQLCLALIKDHFCLYSDSEINSQIRELLNSNLLATDAPNDRLTDSILLWRNI